MLTQLSSAFSGTLFFNEIQHSNALYLITCFASCTNDFATPMQISLTTYCADQVPKRLTMERKRLLNRSLVTARLSKHLHKFHDYLNLLCRRTRIPFNLLSMTVLLAGKTDFPCRGRVHSVSSRSLAFIYLCRICLACN